MADLSGLATPFSDLIKGNSEDDTLVGLAGNDTLRGNGGTNVYTGGLGDDTFFISSLATLETITDFTSGEDVLNVQDLGLTYFSEFDSVTSTAAGTTLVEGGTTIYLDGVTSVTASDFDFLSINGTVGNDLMSGDATENKFRGLEGDDTLIGADGDDELRGGEGNDRVFGGNDNDLLVGGANNDTVHGGAGDDDIRGGTDDDILRGDTGSDTLDGEEGNDVLNGGDDNDILFGNEGNDSLFGGNGDDRLFAGTGDDRLNGGDGDDRMHGGTGSDLLKGGLGNDVLIGGQGYDFMVGGDGSDSFVFRTDEEALDVILDFTSGEDLLIVRGLGVREMGDVTQTIYGDDLAVSFDGLDQLIWLEGQAGTTLTADDFKFDESIVIE